MSGKNGGLNTVRGFRDGIGKEGGGKGDVNMARRRALQRDKQKTKWKKNACGTVWSGDRKHSRIIDSI